MNIIAVIKSNGLNFENITSPDQIQNLIKPYLEFKSIEPDNLMELIINTINLKPELLGDTGMVSDNFNFIHQICYNSENNINPNNLSSILINNGEKIYGDSVYIKQKINSEYYCELSDINLDEITKIIFSKLSHKAILINPNNYQEIIFTESPCENLDNYICIENIIFEFQVYAYIQKNPVNNIINPLATKIIGFHRVHGSVILTLKSSQFEYIDLDLNLFYKLVKICNIPPNLRNKYEKPENKNKKLPLAYNKYHILNSKFLETKKKICEYCRVEFPEFFVCTGCYRTYYHNKACQTADWTNHKGACLFGSNPVHLKLKNRAK